jgi:hypothetical protein
VSRRRRKAVNVAQPVTMSVTTVMATPIQGVESCTGAGVVCAGLAVVYATTARMRPTTSARAPIISHLLSRFHWAVTSRSARCSAGVTAASACFSRRRIAANANAIEVMTTIRDLGERGIVLRSLREGIDTSNATGRMVAGVLASLAELELELGRERRSAARDARRARGQAIGRPKALDESKANLARRMHASGEAVSVIGHTLGVSRAMVYRVLAEQTDQKG